MRQRGMASYNEFLFYAGQILATAGLPLGLLTREIFSRSGRGSWIVGLSGIAVFILSLVGGVFISLSAFYIVRQ